MRLFRVVCIGLALLPALRAADALTAAEIGRKLGEITLDPQQTYRVRELQLTRGDIDIYLTEGVLSFLSPVAGRYVAAAFTIEGAEAGDAEILVLPPRRSERASLASFAKTPNLDEHFRSAIFLFSDNTANELLSQLQDKPVHKAPELAAQFAPVLDRLLRAVASEVSVRMAQALLDNHEPAQGFFYGLIGGRDVGPFDVMYDPTEFEPVSLGRTVNGPDGERRFQLWTDFRPRHAPAYVSPLPRISDYHLDTTIHADLSMSVTASFKLKANAEDGRAILFGLSERLRVLTATVDGEPAEVFQRESTPLADPKPSPDPRHTGIFLLVSGAPLEAGTMHKVEIQYSGSVIRQTPNGSYFVDERNVWYPYCGPTLTTFDLTFRCPERLRLVSTGEPVSENVADGVRIVHRRTQRPEGLAGFNLGDYKLSAEDRGPYRVECYADASASQGLGDIARQTAELLDYYTQRWIKLPIHNLSVAPIPGYFGQGFPGLVYLSSVSYVPLAERPAQLRGQRMDTFFSAMLLAHEVAHQWWGNIVIPADYRTSWLVEAMANYSALQFLEKSQGLAAQDAVLDLYRDELMEAQDGKTIESAGPVDFGQRLIDAASPQAWRTIIYEKGTWVMHMIHQRLGDEAFNRMQVRLLQEFATKPITNEDFRRVAGEFVPAGAPDKTLSAFFDTWIYGTGIPKLHLARSGRTQNLDVAHVDDDFTADVPLRCGSGAKQHLRWIRAAAGENVIDAGPGVCELPARADYLYSQ